MKICKNCNSQNDDNQAFCGQCGAKFEDIASVQPVTPVESVTPTQDNMQTVVNNQVPNQNKKPNIILIISLVVAGLAICALVAIFVIKPLLSDKPKNNSRDNGTVENGNTNEEETKTYEVGEQVTLLDDSSWHVISSNGKKVTLLLDKLVADKMGYGASASEEHQKYENSNVKKYVEETYLSELKKSLKKYNGDTTNLKARLITMNEFLQLAGQKMVSDGMYSNVDFDRTDEQVKNQEWLKLTGTFWTMSNVKDYNPSYDRYGAYAVLVRDGTILLWSDYSAKNNAEGYTGSYFGIRPVIETTTNNIK